MIANLHTSESCGSIMMTFLCIEILLWLVWIKFLGGREADAQLNHLLKNAHVKGKKKGGGA